MTLIIGLGCSDGVILASDSASTDPEADTMQSVNKVSYLSNAKMLCAGSGNVGTIQKVNAALASLNLNKNQMKMRNSMCKAVNPAQKAMMSQYVAPPMPYNPQFPTATFLFVAFVEGKPWVIEIDKEGIDQEYGKPYGYFHAIGYGSKHAQALIEPHRHSERNLDQGKLLAYQILEDSIKISTKGLSGPIQIYVINSNGRQSVLDKEEMMRLGHSCEYWRQILRDSLVEALAPQDTPTTVPEFPLPNS